jgi:cytochrome b subunit of formate dehydrogenase
MNNIEMAEREIPKEIERFNVTFRVQHVLMLVTFLLLSFTGWALKYPEIEPSKWWVRIWGGPDTAGKIHRVAGVTMLLDFIWHVIYLGYLFATGRMGFSKVTTIVPLPHDVVDVVKNFAYFFGLSRNKPRFGRFSYIHKFDYWAVFWGMFIIGISGFVLAFPVFSSGFFPSFTLGWIWPMLRILHSDEALLAIVFILFWHFFNEHLKWGKFPMSWTWITGKISVEDLKHEHPLEYERIFGRGGKEQQK